MSDVAALCIWAVLIYGFYRLHKLIKNGLAILLAVVPAYALDLPSTPAPVSGPAPASVSVVAGGIVSMGGGTTAGIRPTVSVAVDFAIAKAVMSPRSVVGLELGALAGESLDIASPETWQTLSFRALLYQPISGLFVSPYVGGGFSTRLPGDTEPRDKTARWWSAGLRVAGERGWLEMGLGLDQRLGGDTYAPTGHFRGSLLIGERGGVNAYLSMEAILALNLGFYPGRVDAVTASVVLGR